jgi:predicted RNase H-like HicB family nuclease
MNRVLARRVILRPIEDGWWLAEVPSLPGCLTQGETREEALLNIKEAIELYVEGLQEDGMPIPDDDYQAAELIAL